MAAVEKLVKQRVGRRLEALMEAARSCPHPTWQSKESRARAASFLLDESRRSKNGVLLNLGSASKRLPAGCLNMDLLPGREVDFQGDLLMLPVKSGSVHAVVCTGVLEHVRDARLAVEEIFRILADHGRAFVEVPFMQTVHASPSDYCRWTLDGLRQLMSAFHIHEIKIVAGPASSLAWLFQHTMAMLFSFHSRLLYKIGLRLFGWMAIPISWFDILIEKHPMASHAASGLSILVEKNGDGPMQ